MYEQVEEPKENKSRAVANSVTQKKSKVKQEFGFVDNRPGAVMQRKPLDGSKLNVAGEDHSESGKRRTEEKKYAWETANIPKQNYWREKFFKNTKGGKEEKGDPDELILEFRLATTEQSISDLEQTHELKYIRAAIKKLDAVDTSIANDSHLQGDKENRPNLEKTSEQLRKKLEEAGNLLKASSDKTEIDQKLVWVRNYMNQLQGLYASRMGSITMTEGYNETRMDRSIAMLTAASHYTGGKGLWKIGNNHVIDIIKVASEGKEKGTFRKEIKDFESKAVIMDKGEFNSGYNTWQTTHKAELPDPKATGGIPFDPGLTEHATTVGDIKAKLEAPPTPIKEARTDTVETGAKVSVRDLKARIEAQSQPTERDTKEG